MVYFNYLYSLSLLIILEEDPVFLSILILSLSLSNEINPANTVMPATIKKTVSRDPMKAGAKT